LKKRQRSMDEELKAKWKDFVKKNGDEAYCRIDKFLTDLEKAYKKNKVKEFQRKGADFQTASVKARQSWVVYVGNMLESIIHLAVEPIVKKYGAKIISDREIRRNTTNAELDLVRRALLVHFNRYSFLPDADLVIYRYNKKQNVVKILAILSVKNSFRERYTETPYWKLKLKESQITRGIRVFMVTTDRDDEISYAEKPSKARVILEYELDGVYITKKKEEFNASDKIGNLTDLFEELIRILKDGDGGVPRDKTGKCF
jgi:type II restriction enzyme